MKEIEALQPEYIFETSWEVCNHVGGIYTVLSTRAATMQSEHHDKVLFFGPDWGAHSDIFFTEDPSLFSQWPRLHHARVGRWNVPGNPIAILLRWDDLWAQKDGIYAEAYRLFGVQSHAAYGDYDESCLFAYAAGQVMESIYHYLHLEYTPVAMHANEWQTAFSIFYLKVHCPAIATLFTTHATSMGRSIAGNGKPLYDQFEHYNGDQMAQELNMVSKHSVEKQAAIHADCFTTVSDITARECKQLLDKAVDIVTPNGFEPDFVPSSKAYTKQRSLARKALLNYARTHVTPSASGNPQEPFMICIAGRQEWKNKGIDVFIDAMRTLSQKVNSHSQAPEVYAFVMIPYLEQAPIQSGKLTVFFVPYYLNGKDPIFGMTYYDLLSGMDLSIFPSYYEPWGYTPLESIAFHVPTITTSLAGFGVWAEQTLTPAQTNLHNGVAVIHRTDANYYDVVHQTAEAAFQYMLLSPEEQQQARKQAHKLSKKAEWKHFFRFYRQAYTIALRKRTF